MRYLTLAAIAATAFALPAGVSAQASASVAAEANVLAPISVANEQDLQFGDVIPGFPTTVAPADAGAGRLQVSGAGTLEVTASWRARSSGDRSGRISSID